MIELLCHNSIRLTGDKTIYIDPYKIDKNYKDADYIFITHSHYDHFSEEDIEKIMKSTTKLVTVETSREVALKLVEKENLTIVEPNRRYKIDDINFETTYAYNIEKSFHPKENKWVGYIINFDNKVYYIAGDTDNIPEIQNVKADVAFIPIGGTYTMDYKEAANLANKIKSNIIVPTHYGLIVGSKEDAEEFKKLVTDKDVKIFI